MHIACPLFTSPFRLLLQETEARFWQHSKQGNKTERAHSHPCHTTSRTTSLLTNEELGFLYDNFAVSSESDSLTRFQESVLFSVITHNIFSLSFKRTMFFALALLCCVCIAQNCVTLVPLEVVIAASLGLTCGDGVLTCNNVGDGLCHIVGVNADLNATGNAVRAFFLVSTKVVCFFFLFLNLKKPFLRAIQGDLIFVQSSANLVNLTRLETIAGRAIFEKNADLNVIALKSLNVVQGEFVIKNQVVLSEVYVGSDSFNHMKSFSLTNAPFLSSVDVRTNSIDLLTISQCGQSSSSGVSLLFRKLKRSVSFQLNQTVLSQFEFPLLAEIDLLTVILCETRGGLRVASFQNLTVVKTTVEFRSNEGFTLDASSLVTCGGGLVFSGNSFSKDLAFGWRKSAFESISVEIYDNPDLESIVIGNSTMLRYLAVSLNPLLKSMICPSRDLGNVELNTLPSLSNGVLGSEDGTAGSFSYVESASYTSVVSVRVLSSHFTGNVSVFNLIQGKNQRKNQKKKTIDGFVCC
jgi:hypothetical protein